MLYSKKLREIREERKITQYDLSKLLNLHIFVYGQYEREDYIMPLKHLNTICNYFDVSINYVFELTDTLNYPNSKKEIDRKLSGERLKEFRVEHNLTQSKLASILNTTRTVIAGYESGRRLIATPFLYTICKKYYISADYLLGKTDIK